MKKPVLVVRSRILVWVAALELANVINTLRAKPKSMNPCAGVAGVVPRFADPTQSLTRITKLKSILINAKGVAVALPLARLTPFRRFRGTQTPCWEREWLNIQ